MSAVWEHSAAKGGDLLVLLALADFSDDSGCSYPLVTTLAHKARLSERATQYAIKNLVEMGELTVEHRDGGRGRSSLFKVQNLHLLKGAKSAPFNEKGAVCDTERVQSATKRVQPTAPRTVKNRQIKEPGEANASLYGESIQKADAIWRNHPGYQPTVAFFDTLRDTYPRVNLVKEAVKMDGWLQRHPRRKCSRDFILNWLDKALRDLEVEPNGRTYAAAGRAGRKRTDDYDRSGWFS